MSRDSRAGGSGYAILISAVAALSFVFVLRRVRETKGRAFEEI